jgi:hypothetical protein
MMEDVLNRLRVLVSLLILAPFCASGGCGAPAAPSGTTLVGTVLRGPVQPVCQVAVPCDAPFSAGFTAEQGGRVVAAFRSDSQGHFEVKLIPGEYVVVPDPDAPIISPKAQAKDVVVGSAAPTTVLLHFDTGIR